MPASRAPGRPWEVTGCPSTSTVPASGRCTPASVLISVDLPAPFSPATACNWPGYRARETSRSAATLPKDLLTRDRPSTGTAPAAAAAVASGTATPRMKPFIEKATLCSHQALVKGTFPHFYPLGPASTTASAAPESGLTTCYCSSDGLARFDGRPRHGRRRT